MLTLECSRIACTSSSTAQYTQKWQDRSWTTITMGELLNTAAQVGHLAKNTEENRRLMLPTTKIMVKGTEVTALVDTRASASFL